MSVPTKEEYDAAKDRQLSNVEAFSSHQPTAEVLADVAVINAYEYAQG
jgi:hypothetical protein